MNLLVPEIFDLVEKVKNKADKIQVLRQNENCRKEQITLDLVVG